MAWGGYPTGGMSAAVARATGPHSGWIEVEKTDVRETETGHDYRDTPLPGAVLTRVASSHIRVGTFQFFAARGDLDAIRCLADHVITRHYPEAVDAANRYRTLLDLVISRQAALIAKWLLVGRIVANQSSRSNGGLTTFDSMNSLLNLYWFEFAGKVYLA
jgi:Protein adenylyltransferase SelO